MKNVTDKHHRPEKQKTGVNSRLRNDRFIGPERLGIILLREMPIIENRIKAQDERIRSKNEQTNSKT